MNFGRKWLGDDCKECRSIILGVRVYSVAQKEQKHRIPFLNSFDFYLISDLKFIILLYPLKLCKIINNL